MIKALLDIQNREGWNDAQMADALSVHRLTWNRVKNGTYNGGRLDRFMVNAARRFPELQGRLPLHSLLTISLERDRISAIPIASVWAA